MDSNTFYIFNKKQYKNDFKCTTTWNTSSSIGDKKYSDYRYKVLLYSKSTSTSNHYIKLINEDCNIILDIFCNMDPVEAGFLLEETAAYKILYGNINEKD